MGNKLYVKMGKVNKMESMYDLAREKSIEYEHEEMTMNPNGNGIELESKYNANSSYQRQIFYEHGIEIKSFIFLNYLFGINKSRDQIPNEVLILINKYASAKGASWSGHNHTYRSFGPSNEPSIDDEAEWEPKEIQLYPSKNTAIHALYDWHSSHSQGKMNINFEGHHDHTNIHVLALKTLQAYFIGVNMPQNGASSASNSTLNMMAKMKAKVKSPRGVLSKSVSFPKKNSRPSIVLNVFERLMTKKVQYLDGETTFNLVIICQSTIDLGAYSRLETHGGDIYIRCKDLIASSNCVISAGDHGKIVIDVQNDIEMKSRVVIKGKSVKIMSENFSLGFSGSIEVMDDVEIDVKNGLSLFDNSIIKARSIELKYKHILEGNGCIIEGTQSVNKIGTDNENNDNNDISEELPSSPAQSQNGSNDEKNEI